MLDVVDTCPCCGDFAFLRNATSYGDIDLYYIQCHNPECRLRTPYDHKETVIEIWNRRDLYAKHISDVEEKMD